MGRCGPGFHSVLLLCALTGWGGGAESEPLGEGQRAPCSWADVGLHFPTSLPGRAALG